MVRSIASSTAVSSSSFMASSISAPISSSYPRQLYLSVATAFTHHVLYASSPSLLSMQKGDSQTKSPFSKSHATDGLYSASYSSFSSSYSGISTTGYKLFSDIYVLLYRSGYYINHNSGILHPSDQHSISCL